MNRAVVLAVLALTACASVHRTGNGSDSHWSKLQVLGPLEAGLLYFDRSGTPPDPRLVHAWGDVCGERDPAAREAAVKAAQPRLEEAAGAAADKGSWSMPLRQVLGNYDLKRGGFATSLQKGSVVRFDRSDFCRQELTFLVAFRNGEAYSNLRLSEEGAKLLVRTNPGRAVVHDVEVEVVGWQPGPPGPTLLVDIVRMRTRDAQGGRLIADTGAPELQLGR